MPAATTAEADWPAYLAGIEQRCREQQASLTPIRREVLEWLYRHPAGLKAYDLLALVRQQRPNATPPTVYRALDFLIEQGLAHKIGRSNTFVVCRHDSHRLPGLFLLCPRCGGISELAAEAALQSLLQTLAQAGYRLDSPEVELSAVCPACLGRA
ncbi:transcriptional repressor [Dechloromonas sp. ZY10]|uniref:transcriptional repressor n=1 Tax=Dechloromonas aquae TaxID=2664436 RepID=UPI0035283FA5